MKKLKIAVFSSLDQCALISFFEKVFPENNRTLDLENKDSDLKNITSNYCNTGNFWCLKHNKKIVGTIGVRKVENYFEIRRFFIFKKYQNQNYGKQMLVTAMKYLYFNNADLIKLATLNECTTIHHLIKSFGFSQTVRYNNSSADYYWQYYITDKSFFKTLFDITMNKLTNSLILNPTENFPDYMDFGTKKLEGLYVSERHKNKNDIVIFGGRDEVINLYEFSKYLWKKSLSAADVDLKTFSGLNAHLILFLCLARKGDTVFLLPEIAGGHFSTEKMLKKIGLNVFHLVTDTINKRINREKTLTLIKEKKPKFIFIDRSEGLTFENFDWINEIDECIKIFDASQYLTQIITGFYPNPLLNGFDYLISSLHKNYPGPQKSIIATSTINKQWNDFLKESKTFISNTHPENIIKSVIPILDFNKINDYSSLCITCFKLPNQGLINEGLPIVLREKNELPTLHIWLLPKSQNEAYNLFLKLEQVNIHVNYRKLPYNLGFGLRIGVNAAVMQGLRPYHISQLIKIISEIYYKKEISSSLRLKAKKLIKEIIVK